MPLTHDQLRTIARQHHAAHSGTSANLADSITVEEHEFGQALADYKALTGKRHLRNTEVLAILRALGYHRDASSAEGEPRG